MKRSSSASSAYARLLLQINAILAIFLFSAAAFASPSVSGVTATSSANNTHKVNIKGAGFGAKPRILVYDDFEAGTNGKPIDLNAATIGSWWDTNTPPVYSSKASKSGSNSLRITNGSGTCRVIAAGKKDSSQRHGLELFTEIFVSWWVKDLGDFPGNGGTKDSFPVDSSTKEIWTMLGNRGDNTSYSCSSGECAGHDIWTPGMGGSPQTRWSLIGGNNTHAEGERNVIQGVKGPAYDGHWHWRFGDWNRWYFWYKLDTKNPYGFSSSAAIGFFNPEMHSYERGLGNLRIMDNQVSAGITEAAWDRIKIPGWYRIVDGQNVLRHIDNVYIAIGPNAQARVEIGNKSNFYDCTKLAIAPATSWSDKEIVVNIPDHLFSDFDQLYVFFINGTGEVSSPGTRLELSNSDQTPSEQVPAQPGKAWVTPN